MSDDVSLLRSPQCIGTWVIDGLDVASPTQNVKTERQTVASILQFYTVFKKVTPYRHRTKNDNEI